MLRVKLAGDSGEVDAQRQSIEVLWDGNAMAQDRQKATQEYKRAISAH
jgi:hypothetical protein